MPRWRPTTGWQRKGAELQDFSIPRVECSNACPWGIVMPRETVDRYLGTSLHFRVLVEDHFGVRATPIRDCGIVLAAVKAAALRPALTPAAGAAVGPESGASAGGRHRVPSGGPGRTRGLVVAGRVEGEFADQPALSRLMMRMCRSSMSRVTQVPRREAPSPIGGAGCGSARWRCRRGLWCRCGLANVTSRADARDSRVISGSLGSAPDR